MNSLRIKLIWSLKNESMEKITFESFIKDFVTMEVEFLEYRKLMWVRVW